MQLQDKLSISTRYSPAGHELVVSSGGVRAILGGGGAAAALYLAGIREFRSVGGISGGSIPAVLMASGMSPPQLIQMAMNIQFPDLVTPTTHLVGRLWGFINKERYENAKPRPAHGIYTSEKLGDYIESLVKGWPEKFWTLAVDGKSIIIFTATGVHELTADDQLIKLSDQPVPLGFAVRATCTVPGIIAAVQYQGRNLFDGALGRDGQCPVGVPIRHWQANPANVIGCCLGEEFNYGWRGFVKGLWKRVWGTPHEPCWPKQAKGAMSIKPTITHIHALRFKLSSDEKWLAIVLGLTAGLRKLKTRGHFVGVKASTADFLLSTLAPLEKPNALKLPAGVISELAEDALSAHGLYERP